MNVILIFCRECLMGLGVLYYMNVVEVIFKFFIGEV